MGVKLTEIFMLLFCEKNSDGTKTLTLKGKDMKQRVGFHIHPKDMYTISQFLLIHKEVRSVDLCYNRFGDEGFKIFIEHYLETENPLLRDLNLMMCDITDNGISRLANVKLKLRSLRLNGNKIGTEGGKKLALVAAKSDTLLHLDVGETDQTLSSVPYFLKILNKNYYTSNIRIIDLSRIIPLFNRYPYDSAHFAESIGAMIQQNETLIELHLQKNQFDGHDIELMIFGLRRNKTLLMLDLGYNKIADCGLEKICCWLNTRPQLVGLNVAGNGITDIGAREISIAMTNSHIRLLDICNNKISPAGILNILYTIKKPYKIRMLCLWGNKFSHETNKVIRRLVMAKVLIQQFLDVKIYEIDQVYYAAYYPADRFKHKYYNVMDYACPITLKIKRNYVPNYLDTPRQVVNFQYYPRLPPIKLPFGNPVFPEKKEKFSNLSDENEVFNFTDEK